MTIPITCNCQTAEQTSLARRNFMLSSALLDAGALVGYSTGNAVSKLAEGSTKTAIRMTALTRERRDQLSPDELTQITKGGNERFRKGEQYPHGVAEKAGKSPRASWSLMPRAWATPTLPSVTDCTRLPSSPGAGWLDAASLGKCRRQ
jgi:hypothetical protein